MNRFCCVLAQMVYTGQRNETINFGGQDVKGQGRTTLKFDLETWQRHNYRPIRSSRLSSNLLLSSRNIAVAF